MKSSSATGISVIMPVHNGGEYLHQAVSSLLDQSFKNIEVIIIDDHSTDDSISKLNLDDRRIRLIKNHHRGIVGALNTGIQNARMPLIARMDADDIALPQRFEQQVDYLYSNSGVKVCSGQVEIFTDQGPPAGGYCHYQRWINDLVHPDQIALNIFVESPIPHPTMVMRKTDLIHLGGYQDNGWPEDYDLWLRAHLEGYRFGKPAGLLLRWRDHDGRLSRNSGRYDKKAFFRAKAFYLTRLYPRRHFRIWGSGPTGALLHDEIVKNSGTVTGFIDVAPRRIGNQKRDKPIADAFRLEKTGELILIAVSARGAREDIRHFLDEKGFIESQDYLCLA